MNDVFIFLVGLIVTATVLSAVALLVWGAANEPRGRGLTVEEERPEAHSSSAETTIATTSPR